MADTIPVRFDRRAVSPALDSRHARNNVASMPSPFQDDWVILGCKRRDSQHVDKYWLTPDGFKWVALPTWPVP